MFKKLISVAAAMLVAAIVLAVMTPAPAAAADPTGSPFYEKVFITNLQERMATAEAFIASWVSTSTAVSVTAAIASATNRIAALEAYSNTVTLKFAAGFDGYVTNSTAYSNTFIYVDGIPTNVVRAATP